MVDLGKYRQELTTELENILSYWMEHSIDTVHGGFFGRIENDNSIHADAPKGLVLNARILWSFSAACHFSGNEKYRAIAQRAYQYLLDHFNDKEYGGAYWTVDAAGNMLNGGKQIYGLAFYLYGLSEYYAVVKEQSVLDEAIQLFRLIEDKSFDAKNQGYFEAFSEDWQPLLDVRLSNKDANAKKTMNTHLHIIEAYANLYKQWPDRLLKNKINQLLEIFDEHMIDNKTGHLALFFDENWKEQPDVISYGHDIEAGWLLQQCAEVVNNAVWVNKFKNHTVAITNAALEGIDSDGGLWYEFDPAKSKLIKEKHWWPQAEAMVGFFNAWEISGNENFLQSSIASWNFIKKYILDKKNGEWIWGIDANNKIMMGQDKVGMWKCPYHNSRACLEIIRRIK